MQTKQTITKKNRRVITKMLEKNITDEIKSTKNNK